MEGTMVEKSEISLYRSEWIILEYLWANAPRTVTQIAKAMEKETGWAKSTTKTLITRMAVKGYLRYEAGGKARQYYPAIDRSEVVTAETENFLDRVYNGSFSLMVNTLTERKNLSQNEIDELRAILNKMEEANQ
jgi:BlaI family penicillinase repressor